MIKYKMFENLQQAEKFVASKPKDSFVDKIEFLYYNKMKEHLKSIGKLGYLYLLTKIIYDSRNVHFSSMKENDIMDYYQKRYEEILDTLNLIIKHKIKIDDYYLSSSYICDLTRKVERELRHRYVNAFIDEWAPGFLKQDLKKKYFVDVQYALFHMGGYEGIKKDIDTEMLRGKMSMFKDPKEWIDYVSSCERETFPENIKKIKNEKDIKIYYEDDDWIMYQPFTYEAMNMIKYPYWCTISKHTYNHLVKMKTYWVIFYNKKIKKDSMIAEFKDRLNYGLNENPIRQGGRILKQFGFNGREEFSLHDYRDFIMWYQHNGKDDNEFDMILKADKWYNSEKSGEKIKENERRIFIVLLKLMEQGKIENLNKK